MLGRRPPRITGRGVNTATRGWVGAPNERAPFRFQYQSSFLSIDVCRGLGISLLRIKHFAKFFSGLSRPNIWRKNTYFRFFLKVGAFIVKNCAHSERYRNLMAGIFEIRFFLQQRVSIIIGLSAQFYVC